MKRRVAVAADLPAAPDDVRRCTVEEWLTAAEVAELRRRPLPLGEVDAEEWYRFNAAMRAWRNWQDFRADWLAEHGVSSRDACRVWPLSRPAWRDDSGSDYERRAPRKRIAPVKVAVQ